MRKQLSWIVLPSLLLGSSLYSFSEKISVNEARSLATEFMSSHTGKATDNLSLVPVFTAGTESNPLYYVFNVADNGGFVIVSGETTTTPVLGFSFEGGYPVKNMPDGMKWMMAGIEKEIKAAPSIQNANSVEQLRKSARKSAARSAEKLLNTPSWSQEGPFNAMIPGKPLVGCVGTAMATIMKYYNYPASGAGSFGGVDFSVAYDWDNMRSDNYRSGFSSTEADAVATLMYHASKSIDTQYAMSGSSAYEVRVPGALSTFFGYDPGVSYKKRSEVATQEQWDNLVKDEIDNGRPVLYCGQDVTAGHAFVCDGYKGEYLHFNWGWGGAANGYFLSTALNPTVSRQHHYNNLNTIIYNIKPGSGSVSAWSPIRITADGNQVGIGSDLTDLSSGQKFTVRVGNLKNVSYNDFKGKIAIALCDANGKMKSLLSGEANFSMQSMGYLFDGTTRFSNCVLPSGVSVAQGDKIRLMTKADGENNWLPVAGELLTTNELDPVVSSPSSFRIALPSGITGASIEGQGSVIKGWDYSFKVTPANALEDVVTVKANGVVLVANGTTYTIPNVREDQNITVLVQKASEVKAKRSIWVAAPGTLSSIIVESETGTIKDLTLFGKIDARDFEFMRTAMNLNRLDISGVTILANGNNQANAIPREAFRGKGSLKEVILPQSVNRLNNGCFRQSGITTINIPANVKTYEYNIFVSCSALRNIYVNRETAEFINWCVLSGVNKNACVLHVPTEKAWTNYSKAENWRDLVNIEVDRAAASNDVLFAVMENAEVKFETESLAGSVAKGSKVSFKATHIADNDNKMEVYANSTKLTADADGNYNVTLNDNTIIHFDLEAPLAVDSNKSPWTLTNKNGSVGLFSDAVNVIPGSEFTIRLNALNVPAGSEQVYWGAVLTDAKGNIKEFISPVNVWTAGAADNFRLNVNCKVSESNVREGNQICIATSYNKKNWNLVKGATADITDALPALNNMSQVYNINVPEVADATISGVTSTAVRGRDLTLKITPKSAAYRVDLSVNGKPLYKGQPSVSYPFVAMEDMNFDVKVYDPKAVAVATFDVKPGELYQAITAETVAAHVVVTGEVYSRDLSRAFSQSFAAKTIKKLDLSGVKIVANVVSPTDKLDQFDNFLPSNLLYNPSAVNAIMPVVEEIILPNSVTVIGEGAFTNCANLKEITLPDALTTDKVVVGYYSSGSERKGFGIDRKAFTGCTSLKKIYLNATPGKSPSGKDIVCFYDPYPSYANGINSGQNVLDGSTALYDLGFWRNGKPDASDVTLIVPEEYLGIYRTAFNNKDYGNPWVAHKFNILSENPVYSVNFDPTKVKAAEGVDVSAIASFLGDNVALESINTGSQLMLVNPGTSCKIFDNGVEIQANADGSIPVEFFNPAKNAAKAGHHQIEVINTHEVAFNATSPLFEITTPEVANENDYAFHTFDNADALSPVLRNVAENSQVRFKVNFTDNNDGLEARVMSGNDELAADADGFYTVSIANAGKAIDIFAVPGNGATLTAEEVAAIKPEESKAITSIALEGEMTAEELAHAVEVFSNVETLDLSGFAGELPSGAFSGMETLTTMVLPEVEEIPEQLFSGCESLKSVDIPASVTAIGAGAFSGCSSLESVELTGISSIGDGAFKGCENLTSITLLAPSGDEKSEARRKVRKASALSSKAFDGVNPNCIVVLDQGVEMPAAKANYLRTAMGMISETNAEGETIEREGRVYSADNDITFVQGYPLTIPYAFTLENDAIVSLEAETFNWTPMIVPFNVEYISDATNSEMTVTLAAEDAETAEGNLIYALPENGDKMVSVESIKANTPVMIRTAENGKTIFSASNVTVPATPSEISVEGKDFTLHASYKAQTLPASETYTLTENAAAFTPAGADDEEVEVRPFELYATSPVKVAEILTALPGTESTVTGIESAQVVVKDFKVMVEGGRMVVYSPENCTETIYKADGSAVKSVKLNAGRNMIELPAAGIYIIRDTKVIL